MLERARRLRDLEGSARVVIEDPDAFFRAAQAEYPNAPVWSGELYLELHRATFTLASQHQGQQPALRTSAARGGALVGRSVHVRTGPRYPYEQLDRLWKTVLLHQFHDILPGSSIAWVYREAEAAYRVARERAGADHRRAVEYLRKPRWQAANEPWVFNPRHAPAPRSCQSPRDRARPTGWSGLADGTVAVFTRVPRLAGAPLRGGVERGRRCEVTAYGNDPRQRTAAGRAERPGPGDLDPGSDRRPRGARPGLCSGNMLQMHPDLPNSWDAWDIDRHYLRPACRRNSVRLASPSSRRARSLVRFGSSGPSAPRRSRRPCG